MGFIEWYESNVKWHIITFNVNEFVLTKVLV